MTEEECTYAIDRGVATITLNAPERLNALSPEMLAGLNKHIDQAGADEDVGVVVLTGAGRGFCAGGNVKGMAGGKLSAIAYEPRVRSLRANMDVVRRIYTLPKPVIAKLRGATAGAGLSIALSCDMRIASDTLKLTTAFAKVGLSGDYGGSWFLTRLVGAAKAKELYLTANVIDSAEALRLGIVNRAVSDAQLDAEVEALARQIADGPRVALSYMKQTITAAETLSLPDALDIEAMRHARTGLTEDHKEASKAWVEKRKPVFQNR
jgi:2-(1,2-epoxy-1,2-dihydrophenyl)acetyl-CoA isomerase